MSNEKNETKRLAGKKRKKNNDCFWMENIFCLESHIHLCSRHTSANPAYVIKTCLTWHAFSGARYWGFVSPKLHVCTYRNHDSIILGNVITSDYIPMSYLGINDQLWWFKPVFNYDNVYLGIDISPNQNHDLIWKIICQTLCDAFL